jgi:hemoglobin
VSTPDAEDANERRSLLTRDIQERTGIDEAMIARLVHTFYGRVREDTLIGPVFDARIEDWDKHLGRMCEFWSSVTLMSGRYHGQPMPAHMRLPVDGSHFDRWLALFEATAAEICPPAAAALFIDKARRIADSFELGISFARGEMKQGPLPSFRRAELLSAAPATTEGAEP